MEQNGKHVTTFDDALHQNNYENNNNSLVLDVPIVPPKEGKQFWTTEPHGYVKLRHVKNESGETGLPPVTIHSLVAETVRKYPSAPALAYKVDPKSSEYTFINYQEYYRQICTAAKAFIKLGLTTGGGVCILGFNSAEWFISNLAAIFAGGLSCGVYTTNSSETCRYILQNCKCEIILVDSPQQLKKILEIQSEIPTVKYIIDWSSSEKETSLEDSHILKWGEMMKIGESESNEILLQRLRDQVPNQCCSLIYTSGTTGVPKGVMLSHDNITWTARTICPTLEIVPNSNARIVSYLPLSHIAAQIGDLFSPIVIGGCTYFAQPDALKGSLKATLIEVKPTMFVAVPRVFEKIQEKFGEVESSMGRVKRAITSWAKAIGTSSQLGSFEGKKKPWLWGMANQLVFSKVRENLGLTNASNIISCAAPISKETVDFFHSYDIPVFEVYGASETCGPQTCNAGQTRCLRSAGKCPVGTKIRLEDVDAEGQGEICMFGRNVFMGYLGSEEKTKEVMTEDGWFRSGDLGKINEAEFVFITGRIKELIVTAGGENVAPIPIEEHIKKELPCIGNAMVVGDKRKFLSVLLAFKTSVNPETNEPLDDLTSAAKEWCFATSGKTFETVSEIRTGDSEAHQKINAAITAAIEKVNAESQSRASRIQKFLILPRDFSLPGGEFGPTLKVRRHIVCQLYEKEIDILYVGGD